MHPDVTWTPKWSLNSYISYFANGPVCHWHLNFFHFPPKYFSELDSANRYRLFLTIVIF